MFHKIFILVFIISNFEKYVQGSPLWLFGGGGTTTERPKLQPWPKMTTYPEQTAMSVLPDDVRFFLYPNPNDITDYDELVYLNFETVELSRYNSSLPLVMINHGFTQSFLSDSPQVIKNAYLQAGYAGKLNIVTVDWGRLSSPWATKGRYIQAFYQSVGPVSDRVSEFLQYMLSAGVLRGGQDIHLIGQSMGAHILAFAARKFTSATGVTVRRLTGTDPAGPVFRLITSDKLKSTDAAFVDVIHTDAGGYGINANLGTVDFYVNKNSKVQPGCETEDAWCSHGKAPHYYAMSIRDHSLTACMEGKSWDPDNCPSQFQVPFGEDCPLWAHGSYVINLMDNTEDLMPQGSLPSGGTQPGDEIMSPHDAS